MLQKDSRFMRKLIFSKRKLTVCATVGTIFLLVNIVLANDDWAQFRGPNGTGISAAKNLPTEFGPDKNVVWKTPLPAGHSSPVLTHDRIFVTAHTPTTKQGKFTYKLFVIALDRKTGKILWQREVPRLNKARLENVNGPASPSPVTETAPCTTSATQSPAGSSTSPSWNSEAGGSPHFAMTLSSRP